MIRAGLCVLLLALAGCATGEDRCADIQDEAQRQLCRIQRVDTEGRPEVDSGIGPPSCHPGSTNPDRNRDRC
jgi:hypothetical protein